MVSYKVIFSPKADKSISKLDNSSKKLVLAWIEKNLEGTNSPRSSGKALSANHKGKWRYRVGNYRIMAEIRDMEILILIVDVGHRRKIYS